MSSAKSTEDRINNLRAEIEGLNGAELERWLTDDSEHLRELLASNEFPDEALIRDYLLGSLNDEQKSNFEERLRQEPKLRAQVTLVEEELSDDYALGRLSAENRRKAEQYFLAVPERRQTLNYSTLLQKSANQLSHSQSATTHEDSLDEALPSAPKAINLERQSSWRPLAAFFQSSRMLGGAATVAALVLLLAIGLAWWAFRGTREESLPTVAETRSETPSSEDSPLPEIPNDVSQTLENQNSNTSSPEVLPRPQQTIAPAPSSASSQQLKGHKRAPTETNQRSRPLRQPVTFAFFSSGSRNSGDNQLRIRTGTRQVRLKFYTGDIPADEYNTFRFVILDSNSREISRRDKLKLKADKTVEALFSAKLFKSDEFRVTVTGIKDGKHSVVADNVLTIIK
jgi:anti-sigma-K factor RskA